MVLIILDNYEQLLPDTRFVAALLRSAPSVKLLITSRIPLNLQAEWRWPLAGLEIPGPKLSLDQVTSSTAVQLFQSSAQRLLPDFQIDEAGMGPVSDICRHLAGLPLAIEIAASWLRLHPLPVLAAKIQEGFAFLTTHARDLPERHRSLRLVFDHSWQLLGETERTAFARLTCFQGSFDLEAALQVTETSIMTLLTLLDHTLLQRLPHDRYGLHPVLHHFARSYLEAQEALFNRHAAYYLNLVAHAAPQFATQAAGEAVTLIANDLDNIRQAWQWAVQQQQVVLLRRSLDGLLSFYQFRGFYQEGRELFAAAAAALAGRPEEQSLVNRLFLAQAACWRKLGEVDTAIQLAERVAATNDPTTLTAAIIALGQLHELRGDFSEALHYLEQAQSFLADQGAPNDRAEVFNRLGKVYRNLTRFDASIAALNQALSINQDIGNDAGAAENHANLGLNYKDTGSYPEAIFHIQQAIALSEKLNHRENIARFTQNLGLVYWQMDALDQALACYRAALVIAEELQSKRGIAMCRGGIAVILRRQHHYEESLDHYQQALRLAEALPDKAMQATLLGNIGNLYKEIGQFDRALTYQEQALAIDRTLGSSGNVARHLGNIGDIHKEQGHFATAIPFYEEAIPHFREIDARYYLCWSLVSYGETLFALGRLAEAAQAQEEGERIAIELDRQLYIFLSRLLSARIAAQRGNIMQASRQLTNLARTFDALEYRAEIAYARWEMQPNEATRQEAGRLFSKLAEETGIFRHRQRAQVLREATT